LARNVIMFLVIWRVSVEFQSIKLCCTIHMFFEEPKCHNLETNMDIITYLKTCF